MCLTGAVNSHEIIAMPTRAMREEDKDYATAKAPHIRDRIVDMYVSQNLKFKAPVKLGDVIEAEVEVIEKFPEKNRVRLRTVCSNQDGTVVIDGEAVVLPPCHS